jgi:hypothetical protein
LTGDTTETAFYDTKIKTAQFYFKKLLPRTRTHVDTIDAGLDSLMAVSAENFAF